MLPHVLDAQKRVPPHGYRKTNRRSRAMVGRDSVEPRRLAQKTCEIFLFPTLGTFVEAKFAFAAIEFVGVHTAAPIAAHLVRHDRMQHFDTGRSEEHTSELQSQSNLVCRLLLEK